MFSVQPVTAFIFSDVFLYDHGLFLLGFFSFVILIVAIVTIKKALCYCQFIAIKYIQCIFLVSTICFFCSIFCYNNILIQVSHKLDVLKCYQHPSQTSCSALSVSERLMPCRQQGLVELAWDFNLWAPRHQVYSIYSSCSVGSLCVSVPFLSGGRERRIGSASQRINDA